MGKNFNIYLTDEAVFELEKLKEKDPKFNFSGWIALQLNSINFKGKMQDPSELRKLLDEKAYQKQVLNSEIDTIERNLTRLNTEIQEKEETKQQEVDKKKMMLENDIEHGTNWILELFETDYSEAYSISNDFYNNERGKGKTLIEFAKSKGLAPKDLNKGSG